MPELGKYAVYVLGAYGGVAVVLAALVIASLRASVRARRDLEALEARGGPRRKTHG
jgi:heme exporter protein D